VNHSKNLHQSAKSADENDPQISQIFADWSNEAAMVG
jgi:hypothetical protein